jgi:hypothetical protein
VKTTWVLYGAAQLGVIRRHNPEGFLFENFIGSFTI